MPSSARITRGLVLGTALAAATFGAVIVPGVANAGPTTVTFSITAGALSISNPASVALGNGTAGASIVGQMGPVTVTDARGLLLASWTATAATTTFTTGGGAAAETIAKANVGYASGLATASTGLSIVLVPGQPIVTAPAALTTPQTAYSLTAGIGSNSATWNPTLNITLPAAAVAGAYTGTITHSVA